MLALLVSGGLVKHNTNLSCEASGRLFKRLLACRWLRSSFEDFVNPGLRLQAMQALLDAADLACQLSPFGLKHNTK